MRRTVPIAALLLALGAFGASASATPRATTHDCVRGKDVPFRTSDGVRLVGHRFGGLRPGTKPVVVLAHQSNGSLCEWLPTARRLAARGIWAFAFDFRGHGSSQGRVRYGRLAADYAAAVKTVRALGARKVVLAGASLGGIAAVVAGASIEPSVAGVAALSAPAVIAGRIDARPSAPRLAVPALFLASREDQNAPYDFAADARALHDAARSTAKRLELVEGRDHGVALMEHPDLLALLEAFVREPVGATSR